MNKEILRILLDKPEIYLRAWVWFYSRIDDNGIVKFAYEDADLMGKIKVSDPTFKKILHTQDEWNIKKKHTSIIYAKEERTFTITFHDPPLEISESEKTTALKINEKKEIKRKLTDEQIRLRKKCVELYIFFYETRFGIKPPINAIQMKFLDQIIKYFKSTGKADTDERVLLAFEMIYKYWDTYPSSINTKYMMNQICYNLPNILAHIRTHHQKSKLGKVESASQKINEAITSGSLDKQIQNLGKRN